MHPLEMGHPLGVKIIALHKLLGFRTFVTDEWSFESLYSQLKRAKYGALSCFGMKEFVLWSASDRAIPFSERGFRSYWDTNCEDQHRQSFADFDSRTAEKEAIKWRSFESEDEAVAYASLFVAVTEGAVACSSAFELRRSALPRIRKGPLVVEVTSDDVQEIGAMVRDLALACRQRIVS
jgi:hypothetical protein